MYASSSSYSIDRNRLVVVARTRYFAMFGSRSRSLHIFFRQLEVTKISASVHLPPGPALFLQLLAQSFTQ